MPGFKYDYKTSTTWEYPHFPRPNIRTAWRFRTYSVKNWGGVALQLRTMSAGLRWDEMNVKPPLSKLTAIPSLKWRKKQLSCVDFSW